MVVIRTHITTLAAPKLPPQRTGEADTVGTLNHRPHTPGRRPWAIIDAVASKSITPRKIPTVLMPTEHPRRLGARQIKSAARSSSNLFAALPRRPRPLRGGIEGCESCLWIAINRCCKPTSSLGSPSAGQHEMHRESASHAHTEVLHGWRPRVAAALLSSGCR